MKPFHLTALLGAGCLLLASVLDAKPRTCRMVFPERPQGTPKMVYVFDGEECLRTSLPSKNLSPVIELPEGDLAIALTPDEVGDPETLPAEAPRLQVPESVTDFYILITPDPENPVLAVKMDLVDPGERGLKPGETLWFNRTDHQIVARLGEARLFVTPKAREISAKPARESGYYTAAFEYQVNGEGPLAPITEQRWWHDAESRHLGFIVTTDDKLPKIYFYRDFRNPE